MRNQNETETIIHTGHGRGFGNQYGDISLGKTTEDENDHCRSSRLKGSSNPGLGRHIILSNINMNMRET